MVGCNEHVHALGMIALVFCHCWFGNQSQAEDTVHFGAASVPVDSQEGGDSAAQDEYENWTQKKCKCCHFVHVVRKHLVSWATLLRC